MPKITETMLKKIISEEIAQVLESSAHDAGAKVMSSASKLLSAIESFREAATGSASAEVSPHLDDLETSLKRIVDSPMQFVDVPKPVAKKVSLKPSGKVM